MLRLLFALACCLAALAGCRHTAAPLPAQGVPPADSLYWALAPEGGIVWQPAGRGLLPHRDHIEMSGRRVSAIIDYRVDAAGQLSVRREVIWPMLHPRLKPGDPDWMAYRAYLRHTFSDSTAPRLLVDGRPLPPGPVVAVRIDGRLAFTHQPAPGLRLVRTLYPSPAATAFYEQWTVTNTGTAPQVVALDGTYAAVTDRSATDTLHVEAMTPQVPAATLRPGGALTATTRYLAWPAAAGRPRTDPAADLAARDSLVAQLGRTLVLETPDPVLDRAFAFARLRAAESLFETRMGLVHSPGGGRYYGGIWANDQAEYAGPFFGYLGFAPAREAALNTYRQFARAMKPDYGRIPASFEIEGTLPCCSKDRGDAAMIAYGAARFALATGDAATAQELWPAVAWGIEYDRRHTTPEGVVASETDEMEGRIPTGDANLSTSALAYGALRAGAALARSVGRADSAAAYDRRADALAAAIERYFGAEIGGAHTYRYFAGHTALRHWAVLPVVMGLDERAQPTVQAVFGTLWRPGRGLEVEQGSGLYWDRGTLYALRAAFAAGLPDLGLRYLNEYTYSRLLGRHVPYAVEAWPEGDEAHLSAESALLARVFTEGLFGLTPTGLHAFRLRPAMPAAWPRMALRNVQAFGARFDVEVQRDGAQLRVRVLSAGRTLADQRIHPGAAVDVSLSPAGR